MKIFNPLLTILLTLSVVSGLPLIAVAEASRKSSYGKDDIDEFCAGSTNKPQPGMQFDGKEASLAVMRLAPGKYEYPNEGILLLFLNKHFLLRLPTNRNGIFGTDGDDFISTEGIVGGCSAEQLSEVILNNNIRIELFELVKPYN